MERFHTIERFNVHYQWQQAKYWYKPWQHLIITGQSPQYKKKKLNWINIFHNFPSIWKKNRCRSSVRVDQLIKLEAEHKQHVKGGTLTTMPSTSETSARLSSKLPSMRDMDTLLSDQWRTTEMGASVKEQMRALGLFSLNRGDSEGSHQCVFPDWVGKGRTEKIMPGSSQWYPIKGSEEMDADWNTGNSTQNTHLWEWLNTGTYHPQQF